MTAIVQHQSSPVPVWWQESPRATSCSSESAIAMQQFLERLMAKNREDRYPTCADARRALKQLIPQDATLVEPRTIDLLNAIRPISLTNANQASGTKLQSSASTTKQRRYFLSMMAAGLLTGAVALPIWFREMVARKKEPADKPKDAGGKSNIPQEVSPAVSTKTGLLFDGEQSVGMSKLPRCRLIRSRSKSSFVSTASSPRNQPILSAGMGKTGWECSSAIPRNWEFADGTASMHSYRLYVHRHLCDDGYTSQGRGTEPRFACLLMERNRTRSLQTIKCQH